MLKGLPSSNPPTLGKFTPPKLHRTAPRERLFDLLDFNRGKQGVWVSGPAGSGKSTLVQSYLSARGIPFIWYRVDAGDVDPASFFYYLGQAVNQAADSAEPRLPLLTPEYLLGLNTFTIRYFEKLGQRFTRPPWLVFDNYQKVPPDSPLQGILRIAVRHVAAGMTLCIISRTDPEPAMARLMANRLMPHIDGSVLAFTLQEYRQVLRLLGYDQTLLQKAEALHQVTGGWIAGLILWLQHARSTPEDYPAADQTPSLIFDYFANEVLDQLDPPVREFLLQVAFLRMMTADNTRRLTGMRPAGKILESFARRNFFLEKSTGSSLCYQFHSLFRRFLQDRAGKTLPEEKLQDLRCRTAAIMAEAGLWEDSVGLYKQARKWEALTELILSQAPALADQGRLRTLTEWINQLPNSVCQRNPALLLWSGIGCMFDHPLEGQKRCIQAFEAFKAAEDLLGQVMSWCPIVDAFFLIRSAFSDLDQWIEEGLRIASALSDEVDPNCYGRFCAGMIAAFVWRRPNHPDMHRWQQKGEELLAVATAPQTTAALLNILCFSYNWFGQANKATGLKARLSSIMERFNREPILQTLWATNEGMCFLCEGRPQQCIEQCETALQYAEDIGIHIYDSLLLSARIYSALLLDRIRRAQECLQEMSENTRPDAIWDWTNYYALSTWVAFMADDLPKAKVLADRNMKLLESCGTPYNIAYMTIIRAQVMLRSGDIAAAQTDLDRVAAMDILPNVVLLKFLFEMTAADIDILRNRREEACDHLRRAFSAAAENGCYLIFGFNRNRLPDLCALALESGIQTAFTETLIQKYRLPPPAVGFTGDSWPYAIKIYSLGRREIYHEGKPIALSSPKAPRKSLDLLRALICTGHKGMPREKLADLLWPDTDGDRALQNINTTLHRLRRLLQQEGAIGNKNGRLILSRQYCWVDAWSFESLHDQAMASGIAAEKTALLKKAVSLYAGPLNADTLPELSFACSERLKTKFLRTILELGRLFHQDHQSAAAIDLYQHALRIDDAAETVYHALIQALKRLGRNTEAIETYHNCHKALKTKLGIEPSPATQALYRDVIASNR